MLMETHLYNDLAVIALIGLSFVLTLRALSLTGERRRRDRDQR